MKNRELCLQLAYCETEKEVIDLLVKQGLWDNSNAWRYFGDNENNFATIGNQQSRPEGALVEKLVNSVDAMLMAECLKRGIDPESPEAPKSITDALLKFFNIYDGKLSNLNPKERGRLAENICLVATGSKTNPCYSVIDKGEGQTPGRMPETREIRGTLLNSFTYFPFKKSHPPSPFNCSGVLSSNHNLQIFFQPIRRHFLNTAFNSFKSFPSRRSFWAAFKSSRDAIAGMVASNYRRAQGA